MTVLALGYSSVQPMQPRAAGSFREIKLEGLFFNLSLLRRRSVYFAWRVTNDIYTERCLNGSTARG